MRLFRQIAISCFALLLPGCFSEPVSNQQVGRGVNSILGGQIVNGVQPNDTNIRKPGTIQQVEIEGRQAIRMVVKFEDEGGALDWNRMGTPGQAQRIQFHERRPGKVMKLGGEYWYRVSFYLERFPSTSSQIVSLFDLKPVYRAPSGRTHPASPIFGSEVKRGSFQIFDSIGSKYQCGEYENANGSYNMACDRVINNAVLGGQSSFSGRWVDVVFHVRWANDETGIFRYWVDGRNRFSYQGNTARGANTFEFKFGPYRHHMVGAQPPLAVSFSSIVRASSCEQLGISECSQLAASGNSPGRRNLQRLDSGQFFELTNLRGNPLSDGAVK